MVEEVTPGPVEVADSQPTVSAEVIATAEAPAGAEASPPAPGTGLTPERVQVLQDHRKWLLGIDHESSVTFDKVLVTLSAGALGIAVNQGRDKGAWLWSLELSWAFFTASLLAILFSYQTARREGATRISEVDWKLSHGEDGPPLVHRHPWHEVSTSTLNGAALLFLVFGICLLVTYAAMNL